MTYSYELTSEASEDVFESYLWYEKQKLGLGEEFLEELDRCKESILLNPETYQIIYEGRVRRFLVKRFPFIILYLLEGDKVIVLSVFNTNQSPKKWKKRF